MIEIIYQIFLHLNSAFYLILFLNLMQNLFPRKKKIPAFVYYGAPWLVFWIIYYYPEYMWGEKIIPYYFYFLCTMSVALVSILLFTGTHQFIEKLIYYLYYYTFYKLLVFILGGFLYMYEREIPRMTYIAWDMGTSFFPIGVMLFVRSLCLKHPLHKSISFLKKYQIALLLYFPLSIFITFQMFDPSVNMPVNYSQAISAFLIIFNLPIFYYLYTIIAESNEQRVKIGKAFAETSMQLSRYKYAILIEEQAKKERHELKNTFFYIQALLKDHKYEQLDAYLQKHLGEMNEIETSIFTNNSLIDYILNTKLAQAQKYNIKTYCEVLIPENLPFNEEAFCTVLLNLLDNAIEASRKEKNPDIHIHMNVRNQYLVFSIRNKTSYNVLEVNPDFKTTKSDAASHGLGMKIVRRTVREAGGIFDTTMESGYFVANVMFPVDG